jgi:hypothetical protein
MRVEQRIGLVFLAVSMVLINVPKAPEVVIGFFMGIGLIDLIVGILPTEAYSAIKSIKVNIKRRFIKRQKKTLCSPWQTGKKNYVA